MRKNTLIAVALLFGSVVSVFGQNKVPVYLDDSKPIKERVEDALSKMTLEEKIAMCHAQSKFSSPGVPRLGIPENWMTDGPHGIRTEVLWDEWSQAGWTNDSCTAFPALTCLAATWNRDMALLYGNSIGQEARYRNKNVLLGPGVNIYRSPLNGRNFEYMGEDPFLSGQMVVPYIKGVQQNGVAACVKHFALNNQETDRNTVNVNVDDRTLYEIYLPAFKAAIQEGGALAIMGSYNKYKGQQCCHNEYLLKDILRKEWGFEGVVISDWGGVHDLNQAIHNGLDMEFGTWTNGLSWGTSNAYDNYYLAQPYLKLIKDGKVGTEELDEKVRRILRLSFLTTMNRNRPYGSFATKEHALVGRKIAEEGIVLLKNKNNMLPIDLNKTKKIAVIGENAIKMMTVGGGSSSLKAKYEVSPLDGLKKRIGSQAEIVYARGYVGDASGSYNGVASGQNLAEKRSAAELQAEAINVAKSADVVIFIGGLNKSDHQDAEGADRKGLELPYDQDKLVSELVKVNKNLVFVNISGNAVAMPWVNEVPGIIQGWFLGTEAGNALAEVLVGDVNPSGKLTFTFPVKLTDNGAHALGDFPGKNNEQTYREGLFVGYRYADKQKIKPLFSFGHGLSYTTFEYGKVTADKKELTADDKITFNVEVKNTGKRDGAEVVQLYITDLKSSLPRPVKELKGFEKVALKAGESKTVSITVDKSALSFFDDKKHDWVAEPGDFEALIGASSSDIKTKVAFKLK
ncbi:glycoside hydrolase family 3 C-terminal domain-containing protein [Solitalea sp. MAHUQ-68]|uniref:Glycoside hydrolase family 3 C-terminal domain-containing protein n=1 Tax=Solitalea agri TaxID=2953739 RepID=A0A9X2EZG8_9SPHI|nr:glycoside hydrolase family 3 C-terminal domain-containing protein [Solitalea agri]MCO4291902.1 glycoside hydrolase family 3 C-terminal domain-containing protein [Solitalea agri]